MTIVSKATLRKRCFAGNTLAALFSCVGCLLVAEVSAAEPSPPVGPFRAATILLRAACPSLSEHPDLAIRFDTDWLNAETWQSAKAPWGPLVGAPVGIQVADPEELRRGGPRKGTHASAEMWLATNGALISFRLGGDGTLVRGRDLEALEEKILAAPDHPVSWLNVYWWRAERSIRLTGLTRRVNEPSHSWRLSSRWSGRRASRRWTSPRCLRRNPPIHDRGRTRLQGSRLSPSR